MLNANYSNQTSVRPNVETPGREKRNDELYNMKLYSIAALFVVLVVPGLCKDVVKEILTVPELVQEDAAKKNEDNVPSKADMLSRSHCADLQGRGFCMFSVIDNKYCPTTCRCLKIALGMESKAIPDARITASSFYDSNHAPQQGRLNFQPYGSKQGSWAARNAKAGEWLQADLGKVTKVTGVATQGRSRSNQWVVSYRLQYSLDGKTFKDYEGGKVFPGNTKSEETIVKHDIKPAITARYSECTAEHGRARQSRARQSTAEHGRARQSTAEHGRARQSTAEHGRARQSTAEHGRARQSTAEHGRAR
ncbi:hypothetical protein QZH41_004465 [Actinostola sp. cb2023]|nr:hypothetical protein QZH41_004465 [Actinostola sp. cb2023]